MIIGADAMWEITEDGAVVTKGLILMGTGHFHIAENGVPAINLVVPFDVMKPEARDEVVREANEMGAWSCVRPDGRSIVMGQTIDGVAPKNLAAVEVMRLLARMI